MNIIYPLIAVLIWSFNTIVIKLSTNVIDPASISFYRWFFALLILTPFCFTKMLKERKEIINNIGKFAILGALGMFLYQALAYYAAATTTASLIGIANGIIPLLTLIFSIFILRDSPSLGLVIGSLISLVGLVLIISNGNPSALIQNGVGKGEILLFIASLSYALYGVLIKKWTINVSRPVSLYVQIFFGVVCLTPLFIIDGGGALNEKNLPLVLYAAVFSSVIATFIWIIGISKLGANRCAFFMNLAPFFTAILSFFILKEELGWPFIIGGILVLVGVTIAQFVRIGRRGFNSNDKITNPS